MKHSHIKPPVWTAAAVIEDISDVWIDEVDPQNEQGAEVLAYFCEDSDHELELRGIAVNDGVTLFYDRSEAVKFLGVENVWRVEEVTATQQHEREIYA